MAAARGYVTRIGLVVVLSLASSGAVAEPWQPRVRPASLSAARDPVPLPRPNPAKEGGQPSEKGGEAAPEQAVPSECRLRLTSDLAVAPSLPPLSGPGDCGAPDVVRLEAVVLADRARIPLNPPATLRCSMAEAVVRWVREDVAPATVALGAPLRTIENFDSYDCRGRNRVAGARLSEHGRANALDVRALHLGDGRTIELTDARASRSFRETMRKSACARFTTVLGPGSDGYHENHVHMDLIERRGGYRMCQWDVRDPGEPRVAATITVDVPLPRPRPKRETSGHTRGSRM